MQQRIKQILSRRHKRRIVDPGLVRSAVLVPIYDKQGEYHILFIKRTQKVKEHKGQISFPGGAYDDKDDTLLNTALRECAEEIGLMAGDVKVLGELDDVVTQGSGYIISPFVAVIPWPYQFKANRVEIEEIIEVPISVLLDIRPSQQETKVMDGETVTSFFYHYEDRVIWGATARMLNQFLDIFARAMEVTG